MKRILSTALLVLLLSAPASGDELRNVKVGDPIPPFTVSTLSGEELKSADLMGKVVVLVYVSAEQRRSEQATEDAAAIVRELRHPDLSLLFMTADVTRIGYFRDKRTQLRINDPFALDIARRVYGELGLIVLPTTLVIDREGKLAHVISSHKANHDHALRTYVRHTLGLIDDKELEVELATRTHTRNRPEDRIARHRAAAALLRDNRLLQDAENELRAALEIDAGHADSLLDLASLLVEQERLAQANEIVTQVLEADPDHRRGKLMLGIVLYHQDDTDQAETILREVLLLNPDPVQTHYYLGLIAEQKRDFEAAAMHFKEALSRLMKDR